VNFFCPQPDLRQDSLPCAIRLCISRTREFWIKPELGVKMIESCPAIRHRLKSMPKLPREVTKVDMT
jgi:hypothetical protein